VIRRVRRALRARRNGDDERGAALVEFAVCLSLIITIAFGVIEFGNAWNEKLEVETAARSGARVGSSLATARLADYGILQATSSVLNDIGLSNVDYVVIYKASNVNGVRQGGCAQDPPVSVSTTTSTTNPCNVYTGAQLASLTQTSFTGTTSCGTTAPDRYWCPLGRQNVQGATGGADYIGVYVKAKYKTATGLFKSPFSIASTAVMRLEPKTT
jgi:Flp pilus assembly protein TadG